MIKSCEDIKTLDEFHKFCDYRSQTSDVGLWETARMLNWNYDCLISPDLLNILLQKKFKDD